MRRRLLVLPALVLTLAACGEGTLNQDELVSTIKSQFSDQGIELTDIRCPDDVAAEKGARVECTGVNPSGTKLFINGSVTSVDGERAQFEAVAEGGLAQGTVIADQAREILEQQVGRPADGMTCPDEVRIPTEPSITCTLTVGGDELDAEVTIDEQGRLEVEVEN